MPSLKDNTKHGELAGRQIADARIANNALFLFFADGEAFKISDQGQSCCEYRHMSTDDSVETLIGATLLYIETKDGPNIEDNDVHETCFVEVATDRGFITLTNHNEHNGYYAGFSLCIEPA